MLPERPRDHISEVLQEVEAVGNLHGVRSGSLGRFGVLSATVPAHHFYSRMLRKPPGEGVRTPVGQYVHQFTTFEIHQNGSIAGSTTESEVIHAQYPGRLVILKVR